MTQDEIIETNRRQMFAAARGARIQIFVSETRIHPEDAHLQYGPISTALREMSEQFVYSSRWEDRLAITAANEFQFYIGGVRDDYSLFYLFLAEFLADEGM